MIYCATKLEGCVCMVGLHPFVDLIDFLCNKGGQVCLHVSMGLLIFLVCNKLKKTWGGVFACLVCIYEIFFLWLVCTLFF